MFPIYIYILHLTLISFHVTQQTVLPIHNTCLDDTTDSWDTGAAAPTFPFHHRQYSSDCPTDIGKQNYYYNLQDSYSQLKFITSDKLCFRSHLRIILIVILYGLYRILSLGPTFTDFIMILKEISNIVMLQLATPPLNCV